MKLEKKLENILSFKKKLFKDNRGYFSEILKEKDLNDKFPFCVMSFSKKNVVRGLHIQTKNPQGKYITVIKGKIFDVAVDLRRKSKTFGKVVTNILSESNSKSIFIPPGFAHGFCSLDKENYIIYSCTKYRDTTSEKTILYKDKDLNIKWPTLNPIISVKDTNGITFRDFKKKYFK
ncbi:MAG: dTDP-4-dehydrorhamnose 3,5-epimerase [Candidatus Pelagibacter sp. TMED142]|nr:MAG: dTDP-4-dehydrorhamnose 3,5-epimerase [Candidatus Pelagibacter sp. TMED142]